MPSEDDLPVALWSGTFRLMGVDLKCHTLSDGQRIIEADSMNAFLEALEDNGHIIDGDPTEFFRWQRGD